MGDWKEWSDWLREGYYISYVRDGIRYYEHIFARDLAHYALEWYETIEAKEKSDPKVYEELTLTQGYDPETNTNRVWQMIFGIKRQCYIYIQLPTDTHRHGIPKVSKPTAEIKRISHFTEGMSDFNEPTFLTEHILLKPGYDRIMWSAYNPCDIDLKPELNIFIARCITERIGTERYGKLYTPVAGEGKEEITKMLADRWAVTLDKLFKRQIPHRPLTLKPVWAPEAE